MEIISKKQPDANVAAAVEVGELIGQTQVFSYLAGRFTAAKAKALTTIHDEKRYRVLGLDWETFCNDKAGISRGLAEKVIRDFKEFGPQYFDLAQVMPINARQYRQIAAAVNEQGLNHGGEMIPIHQKNAPRLAAAVAELRKVAEATTQVKPPVATEPNREIVSSQEVAKAERLLDAAVKQCLWIETRPMLPDVRSRFLRALGQAIETLGHVNYEVVR